MAVRELHSTPNLTLLYAKSALSGSGHHDGQPPDAELLLRDVGIDRDHLASYQRVCGFRISDELPATFPHILAFPLAVQLMTDPAFPFALPGLMHVRNRITQHRPLDAGERLTLRVRIGQFTPHERGTQFDISSDALVRDELVWTEQSTYVRLSGGRDRPGSGASNGGSDLSERVAVSQTTAVWHVPGDAGRRYAAVSGDRNPIHLHPLSARIFGFRRPIAHGMWMKACCLAGLEGRLPDSFRVDVRFRRPLLLPSTVHFVSEPIETGWGFGVHRPGTGKLYLTAELT